MDNVKKNEKESALLDISLARISTAKNKNDGGGWFGGTAAIACCALNT